MKPKIIGRSAGVWVLMFDQIQAIREFGPPEYRRRYEVAWSLSEAFTLLEAQYRHGKVYRMPDTICIGSFRVESSI